MYSNNILFFPILKFLLIFHMFEPDKLNYLNHTLVGRYFNQFFFRDFIFKKTLFEKLQIKSINETSMKIVIIFIVIPTCQFLPFYRGWENTLLPTSRPTSSEEVRYEQKNFSHSHY